MKRDAGVRGLYFALGCKVFLDGGQFISNIGAMARSLSYESTGVIEQQIKPLMQAAAAKGTEQATQDGACEYWKSNLDAVYTIRRTDRIYN